MNNSPESIIHLLNYNRLSPNAGIFTPYAISPAGIIRTDHFMWLHDFLCATGKSRI